MVVRLRRVTGEIPTLMNGISNLYHEAGMGTMLGMLGDWGCRYNTPVPNIFLVAVRVKVPAACWLPPLASVIASLIAVFNSFIELNL